MAKAFKAEEPAAGGPNTVRLFYWSAPTFETPSRRLTARAVDFEASAPSPSRLEKRAPGSKKLPLHCHPKGVHLLSRLQRRRGHRSFLGFHRSPNRARSTSRPRPRLNLLHRPGLRYPCRAKRAARPRAPSHRNAYSHTTRCGLLVCRWRLTLGRSLGGDAPESNESWVNALFSATTEPRLAELGTPRKVPVPAEAAINESAFFTPSRLPVSHVREAGPCWYRKSSIE